MLEAALITVVGVQICATLVQVFVLEFAHLSVKMDVVLLVVELVIVAEIGRAHV